MNSAHECWEKLVAKCSCYQEAQATIPASYGGCCHPRNELKTCTDMDCPLLPHPTIKELKTKSGGRVWVRGMKNEEFEKMSKREAGMFGFLRGVILMFCFITLLLLGQLYLPERPQPTFLQIASSVITLVAGAFLIYGLRIPILKLAKKMATLPATSQMRRESKESRSRREGRAENEIPSARMTRADLSDDRSPPNDSVRPTIKTKEVVP